MKWRRLCCWFDLAACLAALVVTGCGDSLYLGSNLVWSSRFEGGDLSEWPTDAVSVVDIGDPGNVRVSEEHAHSGRYALAITRPPSPFESGPTIGHADALPKEAYYAAWFYLPDDYPLKTYWTVLRLRSFGTSAISPLRKGIEIRLRKLPGGEFTLYVFTNDPTLLQAPLVDPPALVSVGRWFHVETFFRLAPDPSGVLRVWLDGRLVYDFPSRPTGEGELPWFGVSSLSADDGNTALSLLVDDITVSHARATPAELLEKP